MLFGCFLFVWIAWFTAFDFAYEVWFIVFDFAVVLFRLLVGVAGLYLVYVLPWCFCCCGLVSSCCLGFV